MIIQTPQENEIVSVISWIGDIYQIGDEEFDFSQLLDDEVLPQEAVSTSLIVSDITRVNGEIFFTYIRKYQHDGATQDDRFPPTLDNTGDSV